jgi:hypothetical protein
MMKTFTLIIGAIFSLLTAQSQTVNLGNKVWWDVNDNGIRDDGESGMSGVTVTLYQDNDNDGIADAGFTPLTTTTNSYGSYLFSNLTPGSYFAVVDAGWSHFMSTVYGGDPDNNIDKDNNGFSQDPATYKIKGQTISLQPGVEADGTGATNTNTNNTYDMGAWKANGLGDYVWLDSDGNGKQDTGEPGLANVEVRLKNSSGVVLATTTTDVNGMYYFYDPAGYYGTNDYQVEFITPAGYVPTACNMGADDDKDSDPVNGIISSVNVPYGKWDHSFDAGFAPIELPLKLVAFNAMLNNNKTYLNWTTASEINVSHFVIERSPDGVNYSDAGIVFANGNYTDKTNYSFSDNLLNIQSGIVYYRLRSVDADGKAEYSDVRIIRISKQVDNNITILTYPNPVTNELRVTIPSNWQNKKVTYELFQANGQVAKKTESANSNQTETLNVNNLSPGFYIIRVSCNSETALQKIVKQ